MKNTAVLLICILMLCGCGGNESAINQAISFRQKLLASQQCRFECTVTADYGESYYTFDLRCEFDKSGAMTFAVQAPDSISGIRGTVAANGGNLVFDDQALVFPIIADGYISPVSAPWLFMKSLRSGYINSCGAEGDGFRISLDDSFAESPLQLEIWTGSDFSPSRCELLWQGKRILTLQIREFSFM